MPRSHTGGAEVLAFSADRRRLRSVSGLHEAAKVEEFAARASRRGFVARVVSRNSGSGCSKHFPNSTSKDLIRNVPMAWAPQDFSQECGMKRRESIPFIDTNPD